MRLQEVKMGTNVLRKVLTHHGDKVVAGFEAEVIIPLPDTDLVIAPASDFNTWDDVKEYLNLGYNLRVYPTRLDGDYEDWMNQRAKDIVESDPERFMELYDPADYASHQDWLDVAMDDVWDDSTYDEDLAFWRFMEENDWSDFRAMAREYALDPRLFFRSRFQLDSEADVLTHSVYQEADAWDDEIGMPVQVVQHKETNKSSDHWYFEPDGSIEPDDDDAEYGQEIVSPPMSLRDMLASLETFYSFAKSRGYRTNSSTGLHVGISVPDMDKMDLTKFIMFLGDEHILNKFGRDSSIYAKSMSAGLRKEITTPGIFIPTPEDTARKTSLVRQWLDSPKLHELATKVIREYMSDVKYASVNIAHDGYLEIRSPGGDWLSQFQLVYVTVLRLGKAILLASDPNAAKQEYAKKLTKFFERIKPALLSVLPEPESEPEPQLVAGEKRKSRPSHPPERLPR